jgi:brefeldin A-resistance guanine nucleotide exchange factor 1
MLSPIGLYLTNSSVCEIMQSCFQIFFENRLTELLRRTAESMLVDMVQLLFARLPQFKEEIRYSAVKKVGLIFIKAYFVKKMNRLIFFNFI